MKSTILAVASFALSVSVSAQVTYKEVLYDFENWADNTHLDQQLAVKDGVVFHSTDPDTGTVINMNDNPHDLGITGTSGERAMYVGKPGTKLTLDFLQPTEHVAFYASTGSSTHMIHLQLAVFDTNGTQILWTKLKMGVIPEGPVQLAVSINTAGGGMVLGGWWTPLPHPAFFYASGSNGMRMEGLWLNGPQGAPIGHIELTTEAAASTGFMIDDLKIKIAEKQFPSLGDDLVTSTTVNNGTATSADSKFVQPGDTLELDFWSPEDSYTTDAYLAIGQFYPEGQHPGASLGLPGLLLNELADPPIFVLLQSTVEAWGGAPWTFTVPSLPVSFPTALGLQGITISPNAPNGLYATTDMTELIWQ